MAMKLKLLELTDDRARILFEGEGNTYIDALAAELIHDPQVDVAQRKQAFRFTDPNWSSPRSRSATSSCNHRRGKAALRLRRRTPQPDGSARNRVSVL